MSGPGIGRAMVTVSKPLPQRTRGRLVSPREFLSPIRSASDLTRSALTSRCPGLPPGFTLRRRGPFLPGGRRRGLRFLRQIPFRESFGSPGQSGLAIEAGDATIFFFFAPRFRFRLDSRPPSPFRYWMGVAVVAFRVRLPILGGSELPGFPRKGSDRRGAAPQGRKADS